MECLVLICYTYRGKGVIEVKKKSIFKRWWFWLIVIIAVIGMASRGGSEKKNVTGSIDTNNPSAATTPAVTEAPKAKYEILEHKIEGDKYTRYVTGKIKNNTGKEISYAQIEINLYDKDEAQVGTTLDNVTNLEKDGTWVFKAMILEDNAVSYKIKGVSGF